jgi:hypothetical protein
LCRQLCVVLTNGPDRLQALTQLYPEIGEELHHTLLKLHLEGINNRDFKGYKERICIVQSLRRQFPDVEKKDFLNIILHEDMKHVKEAVKVMGRDATSHEQPKGFMNSLKEKAWNGVNSFISSGPGSEFVDVTIKDAEALAAKINDAQFLAELNDIEELPIMKKIVADTRAAALGHFKSLLKKCVKPLTHSALRIQTDHCVAQVYREVASDEEQQSAELRKKFIAEINDLSTSQAGHHS